METYHKRRFEGVGQALSAVSRLASKPKIFLELVTGKGELTPDFREKIMLAVTSVNRCRYCSFVHTLVALREGASLPEIRTLLEGVVDDVDPDEREALLYAQHWADSRGHPDPEARQRLLDAYGDRKTAAIETAIEAIMVGNYFGNTVDYALYHLSRGHLASAD